MPETPDVRKNPVKGGGETEEQTRGRRGGPPRRRLGKKKKRTDGRGEPGWPLTLVSHSPIYRREKIGTLTAKTKNRDFRPLYDGSSRKAHF